MIIGRPDAKSSASGLAALAFGRWFPYNPLVSRKNEPSEYRKLASVDELLRDERVAELVKSHPRKVVVDGLREALDAAREQITSGARAPERASLVDAAAEIIRKRETMSLRGAVNATGVIIHTGLGRAVLCDRAVRAVVEAAGGHSTLEVDVATGKRGSRQDHVTGLLCELTGAESALVVNNNAGAVFVGINTLARGREVIISRGQLVEIGGSFRLPDIIERAGARLVEVGTTNRTRIADYDGALTADTALILRCHPSNFKLTGFVEDTPLEELVALGREMGIPVMDDLGSGALIDLSQFALEPEPTAQQSVSAGADLVCFSGDKLLGASQAGILIGGAEVIDECRSNPLARALRVDKLTLAALEATLRVYREGDPASEIPVIAAIARPLSEIDSQAAKLARKINSLHIEGLRATVTPVESQTGGGSLPGQNLESRALTLKSERLSAEDLSERFRGNEPPIFGRIVKDAFVLDMRTVSPHEAQHILGCVSSLKS